MDGISKIVSLLKTVSEKEAIWPLGHLLQGKQLTPSLSPTAQLLVFTKDKKENDEYGTCSALLYANYTTIIYH